MRLESNENTRGNSGRPLAKRHQPSKYDDKPRRNAVTIDALS